MPAAQLQLAQHENLLRKRYTEDADPHLFPDSLFGVYESS